jgi:microcystin-dependent protein
MGYWPGSTAPANWIFSYGQSLPRTEYAGLFSVFGTAFGSASLTHFNMPPAGVFIRTFYGNSVNDPDRAGRVAAASGGNAGDLVGSFQADAIAEHLHDVKLTNSTGGFVGSNAYADAFLKNETGGDQGAGGLLTDRSPDTARHSTEDNAGGASDTRPTNVNMYLIVKYQ